MLAFNETQEFDLANACRQAILNEQKHKVEETDLLKTYDKAFRELDHGKNFYNPYDENVFESKLKVDFLYYESLLQNLDSSHKESVKKIFDATYKNIQKIYEFVNIEPTFLAGVKQEIFETTLEKRVNKIKDVINETLKSEFYSLSIDHRMKKYGDRAKYLTETLVREQNPVEDSIKYGVKVCVIEDVLMRLAFPGASLSRVKYLTESEDFAKVFDQHILIERFEKLERQINALAKFVSTSV